MRKMVAAHFPGFGPAGRTCGRCFWHRKMERDQRYCRKAMELRGPEVAAMEPSKACLPLSGSTPACKYFQEDNGT